MRDFFDDTPETDPNNRPKHWTDDPRRSSEYVKLRRSFREACRTHRRPDGRYGAPCAECGRDIDYWRTYPDPLSFSVDHLQPIKAAPERALDLSNWRPTHWKCNRSKGTDSPGGESPDDEIDLGIPSEVW
jgi:5-methylcytosine-specific restriction endonuclease McrA